MSSQSSILYAVGSFEQLGKSDWCQFSQGGISVAMMPIPKNVPNFAFGKELKVSFTTKTEQYVNRNKEPRIAYVPAEVLEIKP